MKHDGRKSRELCERKMNMISFTGVLRPMHGAQSGCFHGASMQL